MSGVRDDQLAVCRRQSVEAAVPGGLEKVGIALQTMGAQPLNGLRHLPANGTCGWYIWAGEELSKAADFFQPLHVEHLAKRCPLALKFLALPPGWRFLIAPGQEDVWFDAALLQPEDG